MTGRSGMSDASGGMTSIYRLGRRNIYDLGQALSIRDADHVLVAIQCQFQKRRVLL